MHEKRFNPANLQRLEDPDRVQMFQVDHVLDLCGIRAGMVVADVGAGTGFFAIPIARRVAPGVVMAVDVAPEMLSYLHEKLEQPGMPRNIELVHGADSATKLAEKSCDMVFTSTMWHEIDDHSAALAEFARILRPAGRLVILDWSPKGQRPPGPPLEHRIPRETVESTLEAAEWTVIDSHDLSAHLYFILAARA